MQFINTPLVCESKVCAHYIYDNLSMNKLI